MRKKWKPRIEVLSSKEHGCSIQKWAGVQLRNSKFRIAATHGAFQRAKEAGGIDEMMDPSISPRFVIGRVNRSLLRPPNSPFLSAFFVSKAQIPPSKAARFGLVYSFIRGLMRVRNLELSIKSAAFYTGTDSRCRRFPLWMRTGRLSLSARLPTDLARQKGAKYRYVQMVNLLMFCPIPLQILAFNWILAFTNF